MLRLSINKGKSLEVAVSCCKQSVHKRAIKASVGEVSQEEG
jgi:hypothetical protein